MFCYQCEQTFGGKGCTVQGVCGKDDTTATLQDLLIYATKGIAQYAKRARELGATDPEINRFTAEALFTTITNVNFDPNRLVELIYKAGRMKEKAKDLYEVACLKSSRVPDKLSGPATWTAAKSFEGLVEQGREFSPAKMIGRIGEQKAGLLQFMTHGLKGASAYADHAAILGVADDKFYEKLHKILDLISKEPTELGQLMDGLMDAGQANINAMEMLYRANTNTYGHPVPTRVRMTAAKGKAILVSGHDLLDLEELLRQTEGKDINIYTHGEMLPAHAYPKLRAYNHLVGNWGGAWQEQIHEFPNFPGAILMTTNCIQRPKQEYAQRIFTSGLVAWPGVTHIRNRNFTPVIDAALQAPGFQSTEFPHEINVGFGFQTVVGIADKIVDMVKSGKIRHFFLIGGCDGAKPGRSYYTDFAKMVPKDCVIMTLACGKYRFNKEDFGDIDGVPRLLDVGQCNDAYSAVQIALALSQAFGVDVNELPLSLVLSWYEQKAVAVLLSLLALDIKNIRIGPSLPASLTPDVIEMLHKEYNIQPITTPEQVLKAILG
ncbi:MAG TPA: hydroxylamine reductase [Caldisericia bacterium]|nr:hydroxylamine reductase [Caldisericia bacterium]